MPQIEQQLRPPDNWQDFETLCKKLWGEIWNCLEIKKNGSPGQIQKGVDLYGIPDSEINSKDEKKYYGIQCKKKDINKNDKITEAEIEEEIGKAKEFNPALKKYYIATTASKDVKIEAFVRNKCIDNIRDGLFQIEIFFWEDIVSLIDENRQTHDWYIKNRGYKTNYKIDFTFDDNSTIIIRNPIFKKIITEYKLKPKPKPKPVSQQSNAEQIRLLNLLGMNTHGLQNTLIKAITPSIYGQNLQYIELLKNNKSIFDPPSLNFARLDFSFLISNQSNIALDDFKIRLNFGGNYRKLGVCRKGSLMSNVKYQYDASMSTDSECVLTPFDKILVPEDKYEFDSFYLFPFHDTEQIDIIWKFLSREYNVEGILTIKIEPEFKEETINKFVEDESEVRTEEIIEEYIEEKE